MKSPVHVGTISRARFEEMISDVEDDSSGTFEYEVLVKMMTHNSL